MYKKRLAQMTMVVLLLISLFCTTCSLEGDIEEIYGTLVNKLQWLEENAENDKTYTVAVTGNESIEPQVLDYKGKKVTVRLKGIDQTCIISLSSNGEMFTVYSGVTLVLENNITLQGLNNNTGSLVSINPGGTLVMNTGSQITDNTCVAVGGGVYVVDGTFTMNGGTISGNTAGSYGGGGGVYMNGGTFTMNGGTISGNTAFAANPWGGGAVYMDGGVFTKIGGTIYGYSASDTVNSNVVRSSYVVNDRGHAVYARSFNTGAIKRKETTAGPSVNLSFNGSNGTFSGGWDN